MDRFSGNGAMAVCFLPSKSRFGLTFFSVKGTFTQELRTGSKKCAPGQNGLRKILRLLLALRVELQPLKHGTPRYLRAHLSAHTKPIPFWHIPLRLPHRGVHFGTSFGLIRDGDLFNARPVTFICIGQI